MEKLTIKGLKIDSPFDFSLYIEREIREPRNVPGMMTAKALEEFAMFCFNAGFNAGKLPINRPINFKNLDS